MSKNRNNIVQDVNFGGKQLAYALSTGGSFDFNQGDLLWFDASAHYVKPLDTDAHAAYFAGVAMRPAFIAPYTATQLAGGVAVQKNYEPCALVGFGLIASFLGTAGDTYNDGDPVYLAAGADPQTITNTAASAQGGAGAHPVGVIKFTDSQLAAGAMAYVAGQYYPVLVIAQLPVPSL